MGKPKPTRRCQQKENAHNATLFARKRARFSPVLPLSFSLSLSFSLPLFSGGSLEKESTLSKRIYVARPRDASAFASNVSFLFFSAISFTWVFSCSDGFVITINARKEIDLPFFTKFMGLLRAKQLLSPRSLSPFLIG